LATIASNLEVKVEDRKALLRTKVDFNIKR
jgi:hypothetical protein